jgi:uncharacterized membrane protein
MDFIAFTVSILAILFFFSLKKRLQRIEDVLIGKNITTREEIIYENKKQADISSVPKPVAPRMPKEPDAWQRLLAWAQEEWLLKIGALFLLIGFGWLARYAFLNNWIGPAGRITLGLIAGAAILAVGWWRIQKFTYQGSIFLPLGSSVILVTAYAARYVYGFFTPFSALALMFLSTAFIALASVRFRVKFLSLISIVLAGIVPFLTNAPTTDYIGLYWYLLVVVIGIIWIVGLTGWRFLTFAALLLVFIYSIPHVLGFTSLDIDALLLFAYGFTALFFATSMVGILRAPRSDVKADIITSAGIGLFLLVWVWQATPVEWQSVTLSAWTVVFAIGAFQTLRITRMRYPFYCYGGVGVVLLGAALTAELEGALLTIAFSLEAALVVLLMHRVLKDMRSAILSAILFVIPVSMSLESVIARIWRTTIIHEHFFVLLILGLLLGGAGFILTRGARKENLVESYVPMALIVISSAYFYALVWLSLHAAFMNDDTAVMIALALYTIIGLIMYFGRIAVGFAAPAMRMYGAILLGFVVGRLLLIDVWNMELTGRIITFFIIGALLMSTAFVWRRRHAGESNETMPS